MPVVYMATNVVNGKRYIGATKHTLEKRKAKHLEAAFGRERQCPRFYNALRKYGADNFSWVVLTTLGTAQEAYACEISLIAELTPEYNLTCGGEGRLGPTPGRSVICLEDGHIFDSGKNAAKHYSVDSSVLLKCCKMLNRHCTIGGLHFSYYSDELLSKTARDNLILEIDLAKNQRKRKHAKPRNALIGTKYANGRSAAAALKNSKAVRCITTGKIFQSGSAAAAYYSLSVQAIYKVCLKKRSNLKVGGLAFEYINESSLKPRSTRPVRCVTTGKAFPSIASAAAFYNLSSGPIQRVCAKESHRKTAGGLVFEYADHFEAA